MRQIINPMCFEIQSQYMNTLLNNNFLIQKIIATIIVFTSDLIYYVTLVTDTMSMYYSGDFYTDDKLW